MRVLVVTKLFPNKFEPSFSPFNRHQFAALNKLADVHVLGLIPWFPGVGIISPSSEAGRRVHVPSHEHIDGLNVDHPRVAYLPKIGHVFAGTTYAASLLPTALRWRHRVDVILGSFAYPDAWAALKLGRLLRIPVVVKLHGGDINVLSQLRGLTPRLRWTVSHAQAVVANSHPLIDIAIDYGARPSTAHVIPNGIDKALFRPTDRSAARTHLGESTEGKLILFVGRTEHRKGIMALLDAFTILTKQRSDVRLVMVGKGAQHELCERIIRERSLPVRLTGTLPHEQVAPWIAACDLLTLPSWAEGTPNVVMEALSSGRPVVASSVGGIPGIVTERIQGRLVPPRSPERLAVALAEVLDANYPAQQVAEVAPFMGWDDSARALLTVLEQAATEVV